MKFALISAVLAVAAIGTNAATPAPTKFAPDCTQQQKQVVNQLLRQDVNPAKACYAKAKGDITVLSTSRLCPIEQCRVWLEFMASKAPDCVYDDTNYGREFKAKNLDCLDPSEGSASGGGSTTTPKPTTKSPKSSSSSSSSSLSESSSGSGSLEEPTEEPTEEPAESDSGSTEIEVPEVTTPTVTFPAETPEPITPPPSSAPSVSVAACATVVAAIATALTV